MTYSKKALQELKEKVEAGGIEFYSDKTNAKHPFEAIRMYPAADYAYKAYHGSLDAAIQLLEAVLPGWGWIKRHYAGTPKNNSVMWVTMPGKWWSGHTCEYVDGNDARALLLSIIAALLEKAE